RLRLKALSSKPSLSAKLALAIRHFCARRGACATAAQPPRRLAQLASTRRGMQQSAPARETAMSNAIQAAAMRHGTGATRRRLLALAGAFPLSLCSVSGNAQSRQLVLASYFLHGETAAVEGAQRFAKKATADSAGTVRVSVDLEPPWLPFRAISQAS